MAQKSCSFLLTPRPATACVHEVKMGKTSEQKNLYSKKINRHKKIFCDKNFFSGNACLSHIVNVSVASLEALIRSSSMKCGTSTGRYSFTIAVLNILGKFLEKHQEQSSYSA